GRDRVHARLSLSGARAAGGGARARGGLSAGLGEPRGIAADQARLARRHHGGRCLSLADPVPLRGAAGGGTRIFTSPACGGPAGGVVGMAETGRAAGFARLIGFDMGGTSTDVSHFDGEFERAFETEVAGVRMRAPMMLIHTVAAGGGSILHFDGARQRVGPD